MTFLRITGWTAFIAFCFACIFWELPLQVLTDGLHLMGGLQYVTYILLLTIAVVCAPVVVMPIIPIAAMTLGPFITAILSIVGWSLGAAIAFLIARHYARPYIEDYTVVSNVDVIMQKMSKRTQFWGVVILRLTLPVDIVSYALGLTKSLSFARYIGGTIVGVSWFSFAFAYMGDALIVGDYALLVKISLPSVGIFLIASYIVFLLKK